MTVNGYRGLFFCLSFLRVACVYSCCGIEDEEEVEEEKAA